MHDNLEEKNSKLKTNLENAETKIEELLQIKKELTEENRQIPLLKDEIVNMMNQRDELKNQVESAHSQLLAIRGDQVDQEIMAVPEVFDSFTQVE